MRRRRRSNENCSGQTFLWMKNGKIHPEEVIAREEGDFPVSKIPEKFQ